MRRLLYLIFSFGFLTLGANVALASPTANFSATPTSSCGAIVVQFTDLSTGSPTNWSWNLGNGTTSTLQNPSTTYTATGTYNVSLTVSNASGTDTKTISAFISILAAPAVNFVANDSTPSCGSKTVIFTNSTTSNSSGTPTYYWDFGDGLSSTAQNPPAHTYSIPGNYTVQLVVTNGAGCTQTRAKTSYITVLPNPVAGFTASNTNNCVPPVNASFTNTSSGAASYQWDFGDGGTSTAASPTHNYTVAGSYTVRLIAISAAGCRDTIIKSSQVNIGTLAAGFSAPASTCTRNTVSFTNTTTPGGGGSTWYFGDGTTSTAINPTHSYAAAGTYTVKLVVNYSSCSDSVTHNITVNSGPTSAFSASPVAGCSAPLSVTFSNSTTGATGYLWLFGDGFTSTSAAPTHSYAAAGSYTVMLVSTSSNSCTDTFTQTNYINIQSPTATLNNNPYIGCAPASVTFTPIFNSLVAVSSYSWNFGDGNTGNTGPNISHSYTAAGTYTVTLTATTSTGCTFSATQNVIVGLHTVPSFKATPTNVCFRYPITFVDTSTLGATVSSYLWIFGDGGTSTSPSPVYSYALPGTFTVKLITSNNGCYDTLIKPGYVTINPPRANFTSSYSCSNRKQFTFMNTSNGATSFAWDFGDGGTDTATSPTHTYASFGTYNVRLVATNSVTGCVDTLIQPVRAFILNSGFYAVDTVPCIFTNVYMYANDATLVSYAWTYPGNNAGAISGPYPSTAATYTSFGFFPVKLVVTDQQGCQDSTMKNNYIEVHGPTASFTRTPSVGCQQLTVNFSDNSTASSGRSVISRLWNFGDGSTLTTTSTSITHTYTTVGLFSVRLTVTETGGCTSDTFGSNIITVNRPVASFTSPDTNSCKNGVSNFVNASTGNAPLIYNWSFGDGGTATTQSPTHVYTTVGNYTVRLIVTDAGGCSDTFTRTNYVHVTTVQASFTASDSTAPCPPKFISFTNNSTGATAYNWTFGNGSSATVANPAAIYGTSGTFVVKLVASNTAGCRDSATKSIVIGVGPTGTFSYPPTTGCAPVSITFSSTSSGASSLTYDFGNGVTNTTTANSVSYTYTQPGIYTPTLVLSNASGCNTYVNGTSAISVGKAFAGFYVAPASGCAGTSVQFTDTSSAVGSTISTRSYSFGDGGTSTATNPAHTYNTAGTFSVRQIVTTASGCTDTAYRTLTINPLPAVNAGADVSICAGSSTNLTATGANSYSWSPAAGLSATTGASVTASPTTTTSYIVTGTSTLGCVAKDTVIVTVNPIPTINVATPAAVCAGTAATLTATGATTYSWSPSTGLSAATGGTVSASPGSTTTYTVTGTSLGCSGTANVTVTVNPVPIVAVSGSVTICAGSSTSLTASGANTYSWSPATGLSSTTGAIVSASPASTTVYTVTGTAGGCSASATATVTVTPTPVVTLSGNNAICSGLSTTLTASGATTYLWSPATGLSAATGATVTASPAATTTYTVTGTTSGCSSTATKTLTVNALPAVSAGGNKTICAGASTTLTASGASTYAWSPSTGLSPASGSPVTASPTVTTTYTVTGTDINGCIKTDTARVTVNPLPVVSAGPAQTICPGGSTTLTATGAATYVWSPSAGLSATTGATVTASPSATTTYKIIGTSAAGCVDSNTITINVNSTPVITVSGTKIICTGTSTSLTAGGATSYSWSPATGLSATTGATVTANPTVTTVYTVNGTSGVGCSGTTTVTVTVNPLPTVVSSSPAPICAGASATLSASGASTYSWSPSSGLSASIGSPVTATPSITTVYTVTGTDANGCVNTAKDTVTVNARPVVSAGSNVSICPGGTTALTASGAASYLWSPSTGLSSTTGASVTASPTTTTIYKAVGTNAAGCKDSATVTVTVNATPTVAVTGTTSICRGSSTSLTASGASTYSWSPATGLSSSSGTTVTANPTTTTTYTVTGTSGIGCSATTTVTVTVNPLPNVNAGIDTAVCTGGSVVLTATGATSYVWSPSTGLSSTTLASVTATPTVSTNYIVTGTDANGCVKNDTVLVSVKTLPIISAGSNVSICPGGSTTLTATGGVSYSWSPATGLSAATGATVTASPSSTITYTVTGTGANGCTNTATVQVAVNATPTVTISGNNAICSGGSTTLTASGATNYSWSPATGLSAAAGSTVTASPAATTTYTVTGTSGVGCTGTATFTLTVNPLPSITVSGTKTICNGASTTLTASGASTYSWSPATAISPTTGATVTANPTASITYTVTGTSAAGCVGTTNVTITVNPKPTVTVSPNTAICPGGSTTLTAGGASTYSWSPATGLSSATGATVTASPSATTAYTVTGTDANGCQNTANVTVSVNATPSVSVSGTTTICNGTSTTLTASGATSYSWSPGTGLSATNSATVTATPSTTTTYTVTGTSGVGCSGTTTVTVTVNPLPNVYAGIDTAVCLGNSVVLAATGASTYSWTPSATLSSATSASPTATPTSTTAYIVTGTSAAGCSAKDTVVVTVKPLPFITASGILGICPGGSTTLTASGGSSYVWTPSATLSSGTGTSVTATPAATTSYTVTGTGANGCTNTASITVTVNPKPVITFSGNTSICAGSFTTLTASGAGSYVWSPATGLSSTTTPTVIVSVGSTTTYKVIGTSGAGCVDSANVTVTVHPRPVITVSPDTTVCRNVPVQLNAGGALSYQWTPAAGLSCVSCSNPVALPATTTTYVAHGTDGFGCTDSAAVKITVLPLPTIVANADVSICKGTSTQLTVTGGLSYIWTPAVALSCTTCANPVASPTATTAYMVTGTGANGCTATDTVIVLLYPQPPVNAGPDQTICSGQGAQLQASGAINYVWTPDATLSCGTCANPVATPADNTTYVVIGTDVHGCSDSDAVTISVIQRLPVKATDSASICDGESVKLSAEGGDVYLWYPASTLSCNVCQTPTATPRATTTYYVVIRQGQCFADTLSVPVIVHPLPVVNAGQDQSIILGNTAQLNATGSSIASYSWSPGDYLSCLTCANPVAAPERDITYNVNVRSEFGCEGQDDVTVHVRCDGIQVWMPNTFTPNADGHNDFFYPHGKGVTEITKIRIYDRWGELIWERNNMPVNDRNAGWDGTYKNQLLKPDVYVWILTAKCTNGESLELKGDISLIR